MNIELLQSNVIDQIAAGEVVERPAHLAKELMENSLDAGASCIELEFSEGGRKIKVSDDGHGIAKQELALALARHATSKIKNSDDLNRLRSFGFRGEALASAAAVSRFRLLSRPRSSPEAALIISEFGQLNQAESIAGNFGTIASVEDLFANVPARLKFLKSDTAESSQIKNVFRALALSYPEVEFRLKNKSNFDLIYLPTQEWLLRAQAVLQQKELFFSSAQVGSIKAEVAFASPKEVSGRANQIWIFVQKRWVQDRSLQAAVMDAYRGLLMHGEFPICAVRVEVDPSEVDVNIHPSKSQVKFQDNQTAFRAVHRALRSGLEAAPWLKHHSTSAPVERPIGDIGMPSAPTSVELQTQVELMSEQRVQYKSMQFNLQGKPQQDSPIPADTRETGYWGSLEVIGQVGLTYIVAASPQGMILIDQHAAHERVAFERLMRSWQGADKEVQSLLFPSSLNLSRESAQALLAVKDDLEKMGISIDAAGPETVFLRTHPALLSEKSVTESLSTLAEDLLELGGNYALERKIADICASLACHSVVRAGQSLSREAMRSLLQQMDEFPLSSFCPHGRPVSIAFDFKRLEKEFGRIP